MYNEDHLPGQNTETQCYSGSSYVAFTLFIKQYSPAGRQQSPWSSSAGPLGSPFVPSSVVLSDAALRVHSESNVDTPFEFRIDAVQHVHAKEAFYLDYHCRRGYQSLY